MLSSSSSAALSEAARSHALGPVGELAHLFLQFLDRDRDLLEELVHLIGVVPPKAGTKLDLSQEFCRQIHARMISVAREKMVDAEVAAKESPDDQDDEPHDDGREVDGRASDPQRGHDARTGRSTGSVIASKKRMTGRSDEPGGAGM